MLYEVITFLNARQEIVGYQALHLFELRHPASGRIIAVFRTEAGLLTPYRRHHLTPGLAIREFIRYRLLHPCRRIYWLSSLLHPSSYHLICRLCGELYPDYRTSIPTEVLQLMNELANLFGQDRRAADQPLLIRDEWQVRDKPADKEYWLQSPLPDVQFYLRTNPHYDEGVGLLTLIPLSGPNLMQALFHHLADRWRQGAFERK